MKTKDTVDQKLDQLLDVQREATQVIETIPSDKKTTNQSLVKGNSIVRSDERNIDYKYTRNTLYNLVERGQDAVEGILDLAKEGEHPRAYEVAGQLIKTVADTSEKLLYIQQQMQKMDDHEGINTKTTNNLFVGSTAELQKLLKKSNDG